VPQQQQQQNDPRQVIDLELNAYWRGSKSAGAVATRIAEACRNDPTLTLKDWRISVDPMTVNADSQTSNPDKHLINNFTHTGTGVIFQSLTLLHLAVIKGDLSAVATLLNDKNPSFFHIPRDIDHYSTNNLLHFAGLAARVCPLSQMQADVNKDYILIMKMLSDPTKSDHLTMDVVESQRTARRYHNYAQYEMQARNADGSVSIARIYPREQIMGRQCHADGGTHLHSAAIAGAMDIMNHVATQVRPYRGSQVVSGYGYAYTVPAAFHLGRDDGATPVDFLLACHSDNTEINSIATQIKNSLSNRSSSSSQMPQSAMTVTNNNNNNNNNSPYAAASANPFGQSSGLPAAAASASSSAVTPAQQPTSSAVAMTDDSQPQTTSAPSTPVASSSHLGTLPPSLISSGSPTMFRPPNPGGTGVGVQQMQGHSPPAPGL